MSSGNELRPPGSGPIVMFFTTEDVEGSKARRYPSLLVK
jgi:hypothetical protein